jgi:hypothetical protein
MGGSPQQVGDMLLDERWVTVCFPEGPVGIPRGPDYCVHALSLCRLYDYPAAEALRWSLHASGTAGLGICLETRIIKHRVKWSYDTEAVSAHKHIQGDDRSNTLPDWGAK